MPNTNCLLDDILNINSGIKNIVDLKIQRRNDSENWNIYSSYLVLSDMKSTS